MARLLSLSTAFATVLLSSRQGKRVISEGYLRRCIRPENVKNACDVFAGHNLVLLAIREGVITADNISSFGECTGYLQQHLYAPACKVARGQDSFVIDAILQHAKIIGLIDDDFLAKAQIRRDIFPVNLHADALVRVLTQFAACMDDVDAGPISRDKSTGSGSDCGASGDDLIKPSMVDMWSLKSPRPKCVQDLTIALSHLHKAIREKNTRAKYACLARCILLVFPVTQAYQSKTRSTAANLFLGFSIDCNIPGGLRLSDISCGSMALVDISNFFIARHVFSTDALSKLHLQPRTVILQCVQNSAFLDINHLQATMHAEIAATNAVPSPGALLDIGSSLWLRRCDTSTVSDTMSSSQADMDDLARVRFRAETEAKASESLTIPQCLPLFRDLLHNNDLSNVSVTSREVEDLFFEYSDPLDCFVTEPIFINILSALRSKHSKRKSTHDIMQRNVQLFMSCAEPQRTLSVRMAARVFCRCLASPDNDSSYLASDYRTIFDLLKPFDNEQVGLINEVQFLKFMKSYFGPHAN